MRTFYLIRHAQTVSNQQGVYPTDDTPLTEAGVQQTKKAAGWFKEQTFDTVFVSPLIRARDTALLLGVEGITVPALRDHNMGIHTNKPLGSYKLHCDMRGIDVETYQPENGESYEQAKTRVTDWLKTVNDGKHLVISHTDTMHWIVEELTGHNASRFENVALCVVEGTQVTKLNWKPWL